MTQQKFEQKDIENWLFNHGSAPKDASFPLSKLSKREPEKFAPKTDTSQLQSVGDGIASKRIQIHSGSITDIKIAEGKKGAVATSNNGDLLTGCGYAVAKAIVNAAGAGFQTELYNRFGVPGVMQTPQYAKDNYSKTEGRGYAISCDPHDMRTSHNIDKIEMLTVPMAVTPENEAGVENMYYEAFVHNKDLDFMLVPMAGMSHPVLENSSDKSAKLTMNAFERFVRDYPDSKLNLVCTIFNDKVAEENYKKHALAKDNILENKLAPKKEANPEAKSTTVPSNVNAIPPKTLVQPIEQQKIDVKQFHKSINESANGSKFSIKEFLKSIGIGIVNALKTAWHKVFGKSNEPGIKTQVKENVQEEQSNKPKM